PFPYTTLFRSLAVTDCNVLLGKLQPDFFPAVFGPNGDQPLDAEIVRQKFTELQARVKAEPGATRTIEEMAEGFLAIAVENMANAIKKISVARGYDVTKYVLSSFGGAGGQHACLVADALGMTEVLLHPLAGVLSAYGMGLADQRVLKEKSVEMPLDEAAMAVLTRELDALAEGSRGDMLHQGVPESRITVIRKLHVRYGGSDSSLEVEFGSLPEIKAAFEAAHRQRFGFISPEKQLIAGAVAVEVVGQGERAPDIVEQITDPRPQADIPVLAQRRAYMAGAWRDTPVYDRAALRPGETIRGPAIVIEPTSTIAIEPGWQARLTERRDLVLKRVEALPARKAIGTEVDPVMLEIFNNLFMSIAEQMGSVLEKTAYSVNIKERLDFSCAIFDLEGELIANAPHMPVHLGSMSESIKTVMRKRAGQMKPGDVYVLNAPYAGGTHLPDVTVITPVFDKAGKEVLFYLGSRGHHADIGGTTPGSMPPDSKT